MKKNSSRYIYKEVTTIKKVARSDDERSLQMNSEIDDKNIRPFNLGNNRLGNLALTTCFILEYFRLQKDVLSMLEL